MSLRLPRALRRIGLALCVTALGCLTHASYPIATMVDFRIQCVQTLWTGSPEAPLDVREAFCGCVIKHAEARYDLDEFNRIQLALQRGGYRTDAAGVPPAFVGMLSDCRTALDRGTLHVR